MNNAKPLVLVSLAVTGVFAILGAFARHETPKPRIAFGIAAVGVTLAAVAEVSPELAKAFALLMMGTAVLVEGGPALGAINHYYAKNAGTSSAPVYPTPPPNTSGANAPNVSLP